jgi:hypothetical protein
MNSRRTASTNATSSTQATPDNRAVAETVMASRRNPDAVAEAGPVVPAAPLPLPGNEILALPVPSPVLIAATGSGTVEAAPPASTPAADLGPAGTPAELAGWPEETLLVAAPRGDESAAARTARRLVDLAPQLGSVLAGNLTRPADVADLGRRVSDFFGQLRAADNSESDSGSPLGLAPWLVAVGAATVAWEIARRRLRRPAVLGLSPTDPSESLTWVRRPGRPILSAEEM